MVTAGELSQIMPALPGGKRAAYLPHLQEAMRTFGITGRLREAAFLAQLAHESVQLRYMEEIASGEAYEGRRDLGNTQPGDGRRYKGRGPIQLTGRHNYRKYGQLLGLPLEQHPERAATPEVGFRIAGLYWKLNELNTLADRRDFRGITRAINGGYNGFEDRQRYYRRALAVLDDDGPAGAVTVVVNDHECQRSGFLKDDRAWVPVREVAEELEAWIVGVEPGHVLVSYRESNHRLPVTISDGIGYSPATALAQELGGSAQWDAEERVVTLLIA